MFKNSFSYYIAVVKACVVLILGTLFFLFLALTAHTQTAQIPCPDGYFCEIAYVHDGDTYTLNCNLGHDIFLKDLEVRLYGADAPELATIEGQQVRDCVQLELLPIGTIVYAELLKTRAGKEKTEKYGRLLSKIFIYKNNTKGLDIAEYLTKNSFAKPYFGGTKKQKQMTITYNQEQKMLQMQFSSEEEVQKFQKQEEDKLFLLDAKIKGLQELKEGVIQNIEAVKNGSN